MAERLKRSAAFAAAILGLLAAPVDARGYEFVVLWVDGDVVRTTSSQPPNRSDQTDAVRDGVPYPTTNLRTGRRLMSDDHLRIGRDSALVAIAEDGSVRSLRGEYSGLVSAQGPKSSATTKIALIQGFLAAKRVHRGNPRQPGPPGFLDTVDRSLGVTRPLSPPPAVAISANPWAIPLGFEIRHRVKTNGCHRGSEITFINTDALGDSEPRQFETVITISDRRGTDTALRWVPGNNFVSVPSGTFKSGHEYALSMGELIFRGPIVVHKLPVSRKKPGEILTWMIESGCELQAASLILSLAP